MALKGNQHKIDKNKNNKIDAQDFKILRGEKKMKEEVEDLQERDEGKPGKMFAKIAAKAAKRYGSKEAGLRVAGAIRKKVLAKEDTDLTDEQIDEMILEYESKGGVYRHKGTYGYEGKGAEHGQTDYKEKEKEEKPKKGYGARQNYVRSKKVSGKTYESFTAMLDDYKEQGIKGLFEAMKKKKDMMEQTVEVVDMTDPYDIKTSTVELNQEEVEQVEERAMTEPEMKKREEIVKSMKKNLSGFKQRYGDKAKSVMYATATKQAMKEESDMPAGYQQRDGRMTPKIHPTMSAHDHGHSYARSTIEDAKSKSHALKQHKELLKDNPHPAGSKEHKDWTSGANKAKDEVIKDFK